MIMEKVTITIDTDFIPCMALLKLSGVADTGGQAAYLIAQKEVFLNGLPVMEKRRKIYPGSTVIVKGKQEIVITAEYENK